MSPQENLSKDELRAIFRKKRRLISPQEKIQSEQLVLQHLKKLLVDGHFDAVCGYLGSKHELSITSFLTWVMNRSLPVFCPVVLEEGMDFFALTPDTKLKLNEFGLLEPMESVSLGSIARYKKIMLCCPGVAFDHQGNRLGQGAGYYDKFIQSASNHHFFPIGIGFSSQISPTSLPVLSHDMTVSVLVTPAGIINFEG